MSLNSKASKELSIVGAAYTEDDFQDGRLAGSYAVEDVSRVRLVIPQCSSPTNRAMTSLRRQLPAVPPRSRQHRSRFRPTFMHQRCRFHDRLTSPRSYVLHPRIFESLPSATTARPLCQASHFLELSLPICGRFTRISPTGACRGASPGSTRPSCQSGILSSSRQHESIRESVTTMGIPFYILYLLWRASMVQLLVDLRASRASPKVFQTTAYGRPESATRVINC